MSKGPWFKQNPQAYEALRIDVEARHPLLRVLEEQGSVIVIGTIEVRADSAVIDHFRIKVVLPGNYPDDLPTVFEIGGRLKKIADRHFNTRDESACLFLTDERWKHWPKGAPLSDFLSGPVNQFFLSQIWFDLHGTWIFGERAHAEEGIRQYYQEELGFSEPKKLKIALSYLTNKLIKGHWACPCGSGNVLRKCHGDKLRELQTKITPQQARRTLKYFLDDLPS